MSGAKVHGRAACRRAVGLPLHVRRASQRDVAALTFFFDAFLRRDYFLRRGQLADMIAGRHHEVWIAEVDCVLVGIAITTARTTLVNVLVHPAYRRMGVGRALVAAARPERVRAKIDMSTGDPREFYERLGFRATGRRNERGTVELMRLRAARGAAAARRAACE